MFAIMSRHSAMRRFRLNRLSIRTHEHWRHHSERTISLCNNVRLHIAVIVLACPYETAVTFQYLSDHIIDKTMFVPNLQSIEFGFVFSKRWRALSTCGDSSTYASNISANISLKRPSYFFKIVFFVLIYSGHFLPIAYWKQECAKPRMLYKINEMIVKIELDSKFGQKLTK